MSATPDLLRITAARPEPAPAAFRALVEQWPGPVTIFDAAGRLQWSNAAAAVDLVLADAAALFAAAPAAVAALESARRRVPVGPVDAELGDAEGVVRPWQIRFVAVPGADGVDAVAAVFTRRDERTATALLIARGGPWELVWKQGAWQVEYSEDYFRLLGIDPRGARTDTGEFWMSRAHPDDKGGVIDAFVNFAEGRSEVFEVEYRIRHEDGRWLWLLDRSRAVARDSAGRPLRIIGFALDITVRRAAEDALRASEERFRLATGAVNGVIYESDIATGRTVLHGVERITGELAGAPDTLERWLSMVHPDDRERVRESIHDTRKTGKAYDHLYYRVQPPRGDELHVWHRGSYVRDADGGSMRAIGLIEDVTARIQAEEELRRSEFRFRAVASLAPGFVFEGRAMGAFDDDGCLVYTSDTFASVMDCTYPEFMARGAWEAFCHPDYVPAWREALGRMRASQPVDMELRGKTPAGREVWLRVQSVPILDPESERRTGTIGVAHDITEAKCAELALRESREILQTITAASPTNLTLYDTEHRLVFTNYTLHGAPVSEVVGKHLSAFVPQPYLAEVEAALDKVLRTGEGLDAEGDIIHFGQTQPSNYEVRMRPVRTAEGKVSGVVANISDVTELRRQQADLRLQARIIETIREGVLLLDPAGAILLANPAMHALFGHPEGALAGRNFGELTALGAAAFDRVMARVLQDLDAGEPAQVELEGVRADGARIAVTCIFAAIDIRNERRIVAVLNDITERKRLEREMLQVANREQQRIGSDLHDGLGQQLTGIALLLKGLAARLGRTGGTEVAADVDKVVALVNDAIDSTRSMARGLSPIPAADDGLALALEALAAQITRRHGVKVVVEDELPDAFSFDDGTSTHLYRIVQEALGNALRHGHPRLVTVQLRGDGGQVELVVRDDGCGFDRRAAQGAGLGLKIMRFRAQMIGGDLAVESVPGSGTVIRCHFPFPERTP